MANLADSSKHGTLASSCDKHSFRCNYFSQAADMVDADYHLNGNNVSKRSDSAVEMADFDKAGPSFTSDGSPRIEEPFVGAHNAKKYKVEWNEPDHGVLNDPLITDVAGWFKHQKQS